MDINTYSEQAYKFAVYPSDKALGYLGLSLMGECGELVNVYKKELRNHEGYTVKIMDEAGDIFWYLNAIAIEYGFTMNDIVMHSQMLTWRPGNSIRFEFHRLFQKAVWLEEGLESYADSKNSLVYRATDVYLSLLQVLDYWELDIEDCLDANIKKLTERSEAGTVKTHEWGA